MRTVGQFVVARKCSQASRPPGRAPSPPGECTWWREPCGKDSSRLGDHSSQRSGRVRHGLAIELIGDVHELEGTIQEREVVPALQAGKIGTEGVAEYDPKGIHGA